MENSVGNSDVPEIPKKLRSLDIQSLYVEKSRVSKEGRALKRKWRSSTENKEFSSGQGKKKKKSRKEVSLSSFESVNKKNRKSINAVDWLKLSRLVLDRKNPAKKKNSQDLGGENLQNLSSSNNVSHNLEGNAIPIPKRPRGFLRRKKFQSNHVLKQAGTSRNVSSDAQIVKLTGDSVTSILSSGGKRKKVFDEFKENSSSRANSARHFKAEDGVRYNGGPTSRRVRRNRGKRRESEPKEQNRAKEDEPQVNNPAAICEDL